ncbi:MAG TPA: M15 family metallopeptidase [Pseudoduganella sp.]
MVVVAVVLYFLLACALSWMVLFPAGRAYVSRRLELVGSRFQRSVQNIARRGGAQAGALGSESAMAVRQGGNFLREHKWAALAALVIMLLPAGVAWMASSRTMVGGFDAPVREANQQVADLLHGEQLVPPPALPPVLFMTPEVEVVRPNLVSASRDWALLDKDYSQRLLQAFRIMKERHGYDMALLEGYRSPERQDALAAQGSNVTNAKAFQSWHQYGLAADCAFLRDGKLVISERDPWAMRGYQLFGEVAESLGLTWGGRWKMMDFGHTELRVDGVRKK